MEKMVLKKISFGTFIRIFVFSGISFGVLMGVLLCIVAVSGGPVTANIGVIEFRGVIAGVLGLLICPVAAAISFWCLSIMMYPFFILFIKLSRGIRIKVLVIPEAIPYQITDNKAGGSRIENNQPGNGSDEEQNAELQPETE